jgi:hypothetical protein
MAVKLVAARRGRPQKFGRPSRAVTMTLPEDVIAALDGLDADLGRAVVRLAQPLLADVVHQPPAELAKYGPSAIIIVKPFGALARMGGVTLVPLPDGRALISLDDSMSVHEFELRLRDAIEADGDLEPRERAAMASIGEILKSARRTKGVTVHQRNIIVMQAPGRRQLAN